MRRWVATAASWSRKAVACLAHEAAQAGNAEQRWLVGYDAERLLATLLLEARTLVPLLNEEQIEEAERSARTLASELRARRLSGALLQVDGRTPAEARAFRAKAASLAAPRAERR